MNGNTKSAPFTLTITTGDMQILSLNIIYTAQCEYKQCEEKETENQCNYNDTLSKGIF